MTAEFYYNIQWKNPFGFEKEQTYKCVFPVEKSQLIKLIRSFILID